MNKAHYFTNKHMHYFTSRDDLNVEQLESLGCTFYPTLNKLYAAAADYCDVTVEEVEGNQMVIAGDKVYYGRWDCETVDDLYNTIANYEL